MHPTSLLRRGRMRAIGALTVALLLTLIGVGWAPEARAAVTWNDGGIRYTTVVNCSSIIFGNPYTENGIGAYAGHAVDADTERPKVGEIFYIHVEVFGLGSPCSGTVVQPRFNLPAGVSFAREAPIQCYVNGNGGNAPNNNCPGWDRMAADGTYSGPATGDYPGVFPIPQGVEFEIRVPVKASQPMTGSQWSVTLWTADGNSSPTLTLPATMFVFANAPQADPVVSYPNPSTTLAATTPNNQPTRYGLYSTFDVAGLAGTSGRMLFRLGTSSTSLAEVAAVGIGSGNATASAWTDWDEPGVTLQPGQTYYWRGVFDPGAAGGGDAVSGPVQSFTVPATDPGPDPKADPELDAWAASTSVPRTKPAVLKASLAPDATGTVKFLSNGQRLCVATVSSGRASCSAPARLTPGRYQVVAKYGGDAQYLADRTGFTFTKQR